MEGQNFRNETDAFQKNISIITLFVLSVSAVFKGSLTRKAVILYVDMCCCSCAHSNTLSLCLQQVRTGDLGGYATSDEFTRAVIANLAV